jgi:hypothetical protein
MHHISELLGPVTVAKCIDTDPDGYWKEQYRLAVESYTRLVTAVRDEDRAKMDAAVEVHFQCPYDWKVEER